MNLMRTFTENICEIIIVIKKYEKRTIKIVFQVTP